MSTNFKSRSFHPSTPTTRSVRCKARYFVLIITLFFSLWLLFAMWSITHNDVSKFDRSPQHSVARFVNGNFSKFVKTFRYAFPNNEHHRHANHTTQNLSQILSQEAHVAETQHSIPIPHKKDDKSTTDIKSEQPSGHIIPTKRSRPNQHPDEGSSVLIVGGTGMRQSNRILSLFLYSVIICGSLSLVFVSCLVAVRWEWHAAGRASIEPVGSDHGMLQHTFSYVI